MRARCLGAAPAQQHPMAPARHLYTAAASPPVPDRNPASHPAEGSRSPPCPFLQFSLVCEKGKACFVFVFKE